MQTLFPRMLAAALGLAAVAVSSGARADECVARHAAWMSGAPAPGKRRVERTQLVVTSDVDGWTGQGRLDLGLLRAVVLGNVSVPARFLGGGALVYSDRATGDQAFTVLDPDEVRVQVMFAGGASGLEATLHLDNLRWGTSQVTGVGTCVNANTVLFTAPGMSYLMTFTDVEL